MNSKTYDFNDGFDERNDFLTCENCGKRIKKSRADEWKFTCPRCFGRMYFLN